MAIAKTKQSVGRCFALSVLAGDASAAAQTVNIGGAFWNISAATLGNVVGGAVFVGLLYWLAYAKRKQ